MRLLFLGDLMGRAGRSAAMAAIPDLRRSLDLDFVVVNGENAAGGFGISAKIADEVLAAGADVITGGNHSWDQRDILSYIDGQERLLRPGNYPAGTPGRGAAIFTAATGRKVLVANVMGRVAMDPLDDPFALVDQLLKRYPLGGAVQAAIVDIHAEASSEKMAMGHFCDGRASLVVGTHTHVPTADAQILPGGTAYQTDAGMCGDYDSVIGMDKSEPVRRFTRKTPGERFSPAMGEATVCGVFVETDDRSGLASRIEPVRIGGRLATTRPAAATARTPA